MAANALKKRPAVYPGALLLVILLGVIDYLTGWELQFFVFYFIPVGYAAWHSSRRFSIIVALFSTIIWFLSDALAGHNYSSPLVEYWNSIIRFISFLLIALSVSEIRRRLAIEKRMTADLKEALLQVKTLRGLLPICASCKKIRNDKGYWEKIESYIKNHSEADFTHSLCAECAQKLYPEIYNRAKQPPS
jgi:hypothetical protein